jgi:glycosyltransferase involved in cell wall biosynthesis
MNILQIISSAGLYGAESVILNLSRVLNKSGHRSILGVFANSANPNLQLHERALDEGIESVVIPCSGQLDRAVNRRIRGLAQQAGVDIVHAHGYKADTYAYVALRSAGLPLISTCHGWLDNDARAYLYGVLDRIVLRKYCRVVAVSDEVRQRLLKAGISDERIVVIRNGIDVHRYHGAVSGQEGVPDREEMVVGLVGRLSYEKGVDIFIRAAALVLADHPSARFVVVGDGPDKSELDSLIDELKLGSSVLLSGRCDDMASAYRTFDVMVSASRQEGLPIAILEGMASGLPVVATAVGDVPSLIRNGETGLLLPPEEPSALAGAITNLLNDHELRRRLGLAARRLIEREYSSERMLGDYLAVYESALNGKAERSAEIASHGRREER